MTARSRFDSELEQLKLEMIQMASLAEDAIGRSITAMEQGDKKSAVQIIEEDRGIDDMEKSIESRCLRLLMRQQPVARDLRAISAALKIITDLERIGDHASDIAELTLQLDGEQPVSMAKHIPPMAEIASQMVRACVRSYIESDLELAEKTIQRDDEVDGLFNIVRDELVRVLSEKTGAGASNRAIDFMMIAKYLERIGDHAVNICEWVIFYDTGVHKETPIL